ncbi:MAG: M24 family metallopeptidase [Planctomycetaceae bacterium]|nr:M24 family metallopeptidase [Planctomycetaceae bacterium]
MTRVETVTLPAFGGAEHCPTIPEAVFRSRIEAAVGRMRAASLDVLAVYADREHFANLAYLTGLDPRFEEALLLLDREGNRLLLVGNENMGYLPEADLGLRVELFQEFSLMGQTRKKSRPLRKILAEFGVKRGTRVGCVGWKCYQSRLVATEGESATGQCPLAIDLPAYLVDVLRDLCGDHERVTNAVGIFADPDDGLRITNEPEQIAQFEFAATVTSEGVLAVLRAMRPGVAEDELERLMDTRGLTLSCHRMIGFGEKARRGLASPSGRRAALGDVFTVCVGVTGALTSRAGCIAAGPEDLPSELKDFYPRFAANYFSVVAAWYGAVRVGATAGEVFDAVEAQRDSQLFDFALNPGHYLHLDEWTHSPFAPGSQTKLRSAMAIQMDVIPVSRGPFCYSNAEDGIVLADEALRQRLAEGWPECWSRIERRRAFMTDVLGIRLDASVLPLGNTSGWLPPYALSLEKAFVAG